MSTHKKDRVEENAEEAKRSIVLQIHLNSTEGLLII